MIHEKYQLDPRQQFELSEIETYLAAQEQSVRDKIRRIISTYKPTNTDELIQNDHTVARLVFFRGAGEYDLRLCLEDLEGDLMEVEGELECVFIAWTTGPRLSDTEIISRKKKIAAIEVPLESFTPIFNQTRLFYFLKKIDWLFHAWFARLWQLEGGRKSGIAACIMENNSIKTFDLNRLRWGDYIDSERNGAKTSPFQRDLSQFEMSRFCSLDRPNFYETYWRYFEKEGRFCEIGMYQNFTATRSGGIAEAQVQPLEKLVQHEPDKNYSVYQIQINAAKAVAEFCEQAIADGYREKERPKDLPPTILPNVPEFEDNEGCAQFDSINEAALIDFENTLGATLPAPFRRFLQMFNGCSFPRSSDFPISRMQWRKLHQIWGLKPSEPDSLDAQNKKFSTHLPEGQVAIGLTTTAEILSIKIRRDGAGEVFLWNPHEAIVSIAADFGVFLSNLTQASDEDHEELYHARRNNLEYFRRRLAEGWAINEHFGEYKNNTAVCAAAGANAHETLEFLLQCGALIPRDWSTITWEYDEKTRHLIEKHGIE